MERAWEASPTSLFFGAARQRAVLRAARVRQRHAVVRAPQAPAAERASRIMKADAPRWCASSQMGLNAGASTSAVPQPARNQAPVRSLAPVARALDKGSI